MADVTVCARTLHAGYRFTQRFAHLPAGTELGARHEHGIFALRTLSFAAFIVRPGSGAVLWNLLSIAVWLIGLLALWLLWTRGTPGVPGGTHKRSGRYFGASPKTPRRKGT